LQKSFKGDFETEVSLIWKYLSASGRWSKSLWGVVMGMIFSAIGASILGSCGFKDGGKGFGEMGRIGLAWSILGLPGNLILLNYLVFKAI